MSVLVHSTRSVLVRHLEPYQDFVIFWKSNTKRGIPKRPSSIRAHLGQVPFNVNSYRDLPNRAMFMFIRSDALWVKPMGGDIPKTGGLKLWCPGSDSSTGEFLPNLDPKKNLILTYAKDFSWRKWPKLAKFQRIFFSHCQIFMISSSG